MALWFFKITDITGKLICFYVCTFRTLTMLLEQQCDFACISVGANLNTWSPPSMLGLFCQFVTARKNTVPLSAGFEPARGDPNGFLVHRLNHSATTTHVKPELILWDSADAVAMYTMCAFHMGNRHLPMYHSSACLTDKLKRTRRYQNFC